MASDNTTRGAADPVPAVAEALGGAIARIDAEALPADVRDTCERLLLDVAGLCLVARNTDYVRAASAAWSDPGSATVIGHSSTRSPAAAAFINGTAAHGEDYDDTFEGGPVHTGAVVVPAVLAACEAEGRSGADALLGIAIGVETLCRLCLIVPKAVHKAGFHPTAVFGTIAAAAGVSAALGLTPRQIVDALGTAGSMAGGLIEYLAEGAWTKRMHPGWAAQSGLRAALLGRAGFRGPRTVFEGTHGLINGFAHTTQGDFEALTRHFGTEWHTPKLAFKPYPCGTMIQPYIDCALRLWRAGIQPSQVRGIVCETAEGILHRLWEPLPAKRRPPNGYAAKFATPYCIATALVYGAVGLEHFTDAAVGDEAVLALAAKVAFTVDPDNPYPRRYTGHVRVELQDGRAVEERQSDLRGGAMAPLDRSEIEMKFIANACHGGWRAEEATGAVRAAGRALSGPLDLAIWRK
ncbi:MAG: MmgE/PrpD family protein [Hyphomicrobiaceae bacterium]|nr:MmgE/PrpD family protein [Hyphomicrobiaceae bacterium]